MTIKILFPYLFDIFQDELKPVAEQKRVVIPTYAHDDQGKIETKDGNPIVIKSSWEFRDVPAGELDKTQSQIGDCFLENHSEHFKIMSAQRQGVLRSYEVKSSRQALDEKKLPQPSSSSVNSSCIIS